MNGKTKKIIQWTAGVIFSLLIIFVILISSFEIVLYSDMSVYRKEYEKYESTRLEKSAVVRISLISLL